MIIEFSAGEDEGTLYSAGRAEEIFNLPSERAITRARINWRKPLSWEEDLWKEYLSDLPPLSQSLGPAMLGEGGTVFFWEDGNPYWLLIESEDEEEISFLENFPWANIRHVCQRKDSRTVSFFLPASLLEIGN